jgi:hypothetical protein
MLAWMGHGHKNIVIEAQTFPLSTKFDSGPRYKKYVCESESEEC